jgi:hypothetical protein
MHEPNLFKPHVVYTKQLWADPWSLRPYLRSPQCTFACGPDMSSAILEYQYGNIHRHDAIGYAVFTPLDLSDRYVKIEIDGGPTWYGVVVDSANDRGGEHEVNGVEVVRGTQVFQCRGLEFLLHRKVIDTSIVADGGGEKRIGRAIGFNLGGGLSGSSDKIGNMDDVQVSSAGTGLFAQNLAIAREWTAADILEYLRPYHVPTDLNGIDSLGWALGAGYRAILQNYTPAMQVHDKTFFQVLNELIDRRRLMGWYVGVTPIAETPEIRVFTFNRNAVQLPNQVIPANTNQVNWDFDQDNLVQRFILSTDDATRFDRIVARGEPQGGCFTVSVINGNLEPDWSDAQKTLYETGATTTAAYIASDDPYFRHSANQLARNTDDLRKVFRYYRVPPTFDGQVGANAIWPSYNPVLQGYNFIQPCEFWYPGLRFQDRLPLRIEHDYTNPLAVTDAMKNGSKWEYLRPFVFYQEPGESAYYIDRPNRGEMEDELESSGRFWAASLRMMDDAFGIIVDAPVAHLLGKDSFTPADDDDEKDYEAAIDYSYLYATVFAEADAFVEAYWPANLLNVDYLKELIINVPNARLDYLVPGTYIGVDDDGAAITTLGGFVRDDTEYLQNVARTAFEWYSDPRKSISVTIRDLSQERVRGELILVVGGANNAETINSVVTSCSYDMRGGTATYSTQFAELDAR